MATQRPYKVRKSLDDTKTQLGSYASLDKAIDKVVENPEYNVFYEGVQVYPEIIHEDSIPVMSDNTLDISDYDASDDVVSPIADNYRKESWFSRLLSKLFHH